MNKKLFKKHLSPKQIFLSSIVNIGIKLQTQRFISGYGFELSSPNVKIGSEVMTNTNERKTKIRLRLKLYIVKKIRR